MSRISIEVTPDQHKALKAMALLEGVTMKGLVMERIFAGVPSAKQKKPNARLMAALEETVSGKRKLKPYKSAKELFDEYR